MSLFFNFWRSGFLLAACMACTQVSASVVIGNTRVIFPSDQSEITVKLNNEGNAPTLVQAWVDDGRPEVSIEDLQVPFSVMPALFRLDAGKGQSLRLFRTAESLPTDRESLFWLNVLDMPPKGEGNILQIALRSRIKLLYRPAGLPGSARDAHGTLNWQLAREGAQWVLLATNPGPYVVNLSRLSVLQAGQTTVELTPDHVLPFAMTRFEVPGKVGNGMVTLRYAFIDDHGAVREPKAAVNVAMAD